jgi:Arc/MetJ family transcription regulator
MRYTKTMRKTSVVIDRDIADQAAAILGTETLRDTIDASFREIVNAKKRLELIELLSDPARFDFSSVDQAWGGRD